MKVGDKIMLWYCQDCLQFVSDAGLHVVDHTLEMHKLQVIE